MHWKRELRRKLNASGHSFSSLRLLTPQEPLKIYSGICMRCFLQVRVTTTPGLSASVVQRRPKAGFLYEAINKKDPKTGEASYAVAPCRNVLLYNNYSLEGVIFDE